MVTARRIAVLIIVLLALYASSLYSYLLFHSLAEMFSIGVAFGIFMLAWNSRRFMDSGFLLFLGIAYLFIGSMDLLHTLAYKGMGVFPGYGANLATQLWISARYLESASLLLAPLFLTRKLGAMSALAAYGAAFAALVFLIFAGLFPACFVEGEGLTAFKKNSEYAISLILAASIFVLYKRRRELDRDIFRLIVASVVLTIAAELSFTAYASPFAFSNLTGHYLKIVSFYLIYRAIIASGLVRPYDLLFRNLKKSEDKYRALFEKMLEGLAYCEIVLDEEGRPVDYVFLEVNEAFEKLTGLRKQNVIGRRVTEVIPGIRESAFDWIGAFGKVAQTGQEARFEQYAEPMGRWYTVSAYSPKKGYFVAVFEDITLRKRLEEEMTRYRASLEHMVKERSEELVKTTWRLEDEIEAHMEALGQLAESEERYRKLMESANDAILVADAEAGRILDANRKAGELLGIPLTELIGMHQGELHPPEERDASRIGFQEAVRKGVSTSGELLIQRQDGSRVPVEISTSVIELLGRKIILGIFRDLTERKKLEEELLTSRKIESLGIFAGGLAHDFNNSLSAILNYIAAARASLGGREEKARNMLMSAENTSLMARRLTEELLSYSKGERPLEKKTADMGQLVEKSARLALGGYDTSLELHISPGLWPVEADETQMHQVIGNLVINACQVMEGRGTLRITAENIDLTGEHALPLKDGRYVIISFRDRGRGIPDENLKKIFDPFFTTRRKGTGLGLASAFQIIKRHGGHIAVENNPEGGAVFSVYLPASGKTTPGAVHEAEEMPAMEDKRDSG